ncbi:hypothetical protein MMC14_001166 [Varicellaria rhodocarpa]|nr:hypothetical protein [Varicellaria rhodocarpa]
MESHVHPYVRNAFRKLIIRWDNHWQTSSQCLCEDRSLDLNKPKASSTSPVLIDGFPYQQQRANTPSSENSDALTQPYYTTGPSKLVLASDGTSDHCYAILISAKMMTSLKDILALETKVDKLSTDVGDAVEELDRAKVNFLWTEFERNTGKFPEPFQITYREVLDEEFEDGNKGQPQQKTSAAQSSTLAEVSIVTKPQRTTSNLEEKIPELKISNEIKSQQTRPNREIASIGLEVKNMNQLQQTMLGQTCCAKLETSNESQSQQTTSPESASVSTSNNENQSQYPTLEQGSASTESEVSNESKLQQTILLKNVSIEPKVSNESRSLLDEKLRQDKEKIRSAIKDRDRLEGELSIHKPSLQSQQRAFLMTLKEILQNNGVLENADKGRDEPEAVQEKVQEVIPEATGWGDWGNNNNAWENKTEDSGKKAEGWGNKAEEWGNNNGGWGEKVEDWKAEDWGNNDNQANDGGWGNPGREKEVPVDTPSNGMTLEEFYERAAVDKYYETKDRLRELQDKIGFNRANLREEEANAWRTKSVATDHDSVLSIDMRYLQRFLGVTKDIGAAEEAFEMAFEERMRVELANHAQNLEFWVDNDDDLWSRGLGEWTEEENMNMKDRDRVHRWMEGVSAAGSQEEPEEKGMFEWEAKSLGVGSCLTDREEPGRWRVKIQAVREEGERLRASFGLGPEANLVERCFDTERGRRLRYARSV